MHQYVKIGLIAVVAVIGFSSWLFGISCFGESARLFIRLRKRFLKETDRKRAERATA